jgi:hypothetical protein
MHGEFMQDLALTISLLFGVAIGAKWGFWYADFCYRHEDDDTSKSTSDLRVHDEGKDGVR